VTDIFSEEQRSYVMSRVSSKDTKPEKIVRSFLHRSGFRFRLHMLNLPGKPDIVLAKYMTVIFVHGCFWHRHKDCRKATTPQSRKEFWEEKFKRNVIRDKENCKALRSDGWKIFVVWECELANAQKRSQRLANLVSELNHSVGT
jgi:DNA mismatch endonuclease, patch repair protein